MQDLQRSLQILSMLLQYPDDLRILPQWRQETRAIRDDDVRLLVERFLDHLEGGAEEDLQEQYVRTFDFASKTNLYLCYTDNGEDRERGQTFVELKQIYEEAGLLMTDDELPDYLPLVLEFLSVAPPELAGPLHARFRPGIERVHAELKAVKSPYAGLIEAVQRALEREGAR